MFLIVAKSRIIPESVTLSDSARVCLVPYGASRSPATSTTFQQAQAVPVTTNENVSAPTSVSQTHCRPRPELDIDLTPVYLSPGNSEAGAGPVG